MPFPVRLVTTGAGSLVISVSTVPECTTPAFSAVALALLTALVPFSVPFLVRTVNQSVSVMPSDFVPRSQ